MFLGTWDLHRYLAVYRSVAPAPTRRDLSSPEGRPGIVSERFSSESEGCPQSGFTWFGLMALAIQADLPKTQVGGTIARPGGATRSVHKTVDSWFASSESDASSHRDSLGLADAQLQVSSCTRTRIGAARARRRRRPARGGRRCSP